MSTECQWCVPNARCRAGVLRVETAEPALWESLVHQRPGFIYLGNLGPLLPVNQDSARDWRPAFEGEDVVFVPWMEELLMWWNLKPWWWQLSKSEWQLMEASKSLCTIVSLSVGCEAETKIMSKRKSGSLVFVFMHGVPENLVYQKFSTVWAQQTGVLSWDTHANTWAWYLGSRALLPKLMSRDSKLEGEHMETNIFF